MRNVENDDRMYVTYIRWTIREHAYTLHRFHISAGIYAGFADIKRK